MAANSSENLQKGAMEYISQSVNPIFEPLTTRMVLERPADPAQFMADWLDTELKVYATPVKEEIETLKRENKKLRDVLGSAKSDSRTLSKLDAADQPTGDSDESDRDDDDEDDEVGDLPEVARPNFNRPRHSVSAEAYGEWNKKQEYVPVKVEKTAEQVARINGVLSESFLFSSLDAKDQDIIVGAMKEKVLTEKTRVIQQGDDGNEMYVIEKGQFNCYIKKADDSNGEICVKECFPGDAFGELALLYNAPRAASVESVGAATLWALDRETFNHIVKDAAAKKRTLHENFLTKVPLLAGMDPYERSKVADALRCESYKDGEFILKQGEVGDKFYLLETGEAVATKSFVPGQPPQQVLEYKVGDYFGELALLNNDPRAANVVARGDAVVVCLDRKSFQRLLGPIQEMLLRNKERYEI
eukprot:GHVN01068487.1.p1 GENE.GHVN01068487.1~~GHVN01068487.1.p1  ORF type:complete len:416 (-),score=51.96 GHVN01068487.1:189-1436(-)